MFVYVCESVFEREREKDRERANVFKKGRDKAKKNQLHIGESI